MEIPGLLVRNFDHRESQTAEDVDVEPRISFDCRHRADDEHGHVDASLMQRARDHESVSTVAPGSAQDRRVSIGQIIVGRFEGGDDLPPGVLHQDHRRNTDVVDGLPIGVSHLCGIQHAHLRSNIVHGHRRSSIVWSPSRGVNERDRERQRQNHR